MIKFSDIFRVPHGDLYRYFVGRVTVNFLDTMSGDSQSFISTFFRASHGKLSRYSIGRLTVNILDTMSGVSQSTVCGSSVLNLLHINSES